jgi:signal transduction histidine kinase
MASTKDHDGDHAHPAMRFVHDFTRLITDIDQLMLHIGNGNHNSNGNGNGKRREAKKMNGHADRTRLNDTIAALGIHAQSFAEVMRRTNHQRSAKAGAAGKPEKEVVPLVNELIIRLNRAQTLSSIAEVVGEYCSKAFRSPAGMLFAELEGRLQTISHWCSRDVPAKYLAEGIIEKGPVLRALRTREPVFWHRAQIARSDSTRPVCRLLRRCQSDGVTFIPIAAPGDDCVGVLAMVLQDSEEFVATFRSDLLRLSHLVAGCIVRARDYDEAVAARVRAETTAQNKDEFLSVLAHELKNPMMPILGWAVALSSGTLPADKQTQAMQGIIRNIRSLNYLIEDLFDAMRIYSGKLHLQQSVTRIQDVAREALAAIQYTAETKKLRISTDISEAIPALMADSRRLQQVLTNLLNNAVKFTPSGGSISLQIRRRNHTIECTVSDTGKGIERKFLPFVFEKFRQGNGTSKAYSAGLGLGLSIVREIVALHGGSVEAFSEGTDKGSMFVVRLPLRRRHESNPARKVITAQVLSKVSGKRSAVIGSNPDSRGVE